MHGQSASGLGHDSSKVDTTIVEKSRKLSVKRFGKSF